MSTTAQRRGMTVAEFLAWEEGQEERWEFDGFAPVAMVGATLAHSLIAGNVFGHLWQRLKGGPCRVFQEGVKVEVAGSIRYPDVFVACGPAALTATVADNPVVMVEVLSPSTAATDLVTKNREYASTASIQRTLILSQHRVEATVFQRRGEEWLMTSASGVDAPLEMPEIGVALTLGLFYEGVIGEGVVG